MPASGRVVFLPWVTLPVSVQVGGFRFCPIHRNAMASVVDSDVAETVDQLLKCYVRRDGKPIESCTIVLRPRHSQPWNIPERMWTAASRAAEMLALACLAEQRFLEGHNSPHLNATMFRLIGQGITAGSDQIAPVYPRRGSGLRIGGLRFKDIVFQRPSQIEGTECKVVGIRLLKGLDNARRAQHPVWEPIASSLELFLLGHAETPELGWDSCVMLSAMAFERLLEPQQSTAKAVARAFTELWSPYSRLKLTDAKRIKPDNKPEFVAEQTAWPVHRKWMKELYEARSARAHRGPRSDFSQNWEDWQHMVIAAFSYPLAVKLRLLAAGLYRLDDKEMGACEALDELLDSHWGRGWRKPPEWPSILSIAENARALTAVVKRAYQASRTKTARAGHRGSS